MARFIIALLLLSSVSAKCNDNPGETLQFKSARSLLLVHVTIDGAPLTLVLDTGAQRTIIDDPRNVERPVNVTVGNRTMRLYIAYAPLHINASETVKGVKASGLLGQDVLRQFKTVRVDYATNTVELGER
jgi:hypothetical protein